MLFEFLSQNNFDKKFEVKYILFMYTNVIIFLYLYEIIKDILKLSHIVVYVIITGNVYNVDVTT